MRMRTTTSRKLIVAILGTATAAVGSWLLLAEPSLGRTRNGKSLAGAQRVIRPESHGDGGDAGGVCTPGTLRPLSAPESFIHRGKTRCFESTGNPSGDNS